MTWSARLRAKVNKVGGIDIPLFKVQTLKISTATPAQTTARSLLQVRPSIQS